MSDATTTAGTAMTFHPRPQGGAPKPWDFPAPDRATLDNGMTVLHCHRPGQQVVAVEVLLDAPLDAEPEGLDGVATIMARAFSEGTESMTAEEFAAELERCGATLDAHADHPGVRLSLEVPASRLTKALGLLAEALRAPAFPESEVGRLVRNQLDYTKLCLESIFAHASVPLEVIVVDNGSTDGSGAYLRQLALYRAVLGQLYPGRPIKAALLWTETTEMMEISGPALDAELATIISV